MKTTEDKLNSLLKRILFNDELHLTSRYYEELERYKDEKLEVLSKEYQEGIDEVVGVVETLMDLKKVKERLYQTKEEEMTAGEKNYEAVTASIEEAELLDNDVLNGVKQSIGGLPSTVQASVMFALGSSMIAYTNKYKGSNLVYDSDTGKITRETEI